MVNRPIQLYLFSYSKNTAIAFQKTLLPKSISGKTNLISYDVTFIKNMKNYQQVACILYFISKCCSFELFLWSCRLIVAVPLPGGPQDRASPEAQQAPEDCYIKCSLCGQGLPSWQALREHVDASHPGGAFRCLQCTASFPSRDQLERHEQMHPAVQQVVSTSLYSFSKFSCIVVLGCGP